MFVDASAIVAILTREAEADPLADRLDEATCITSAIAVFEAVAAIGRNHPAQLNLADCFAYAMATNRGVPLLFRGEDFDKTDIADGR